MNPNKPIGEIKDWKESPSSIKVIIFTFFDNIMSSYSFLVRFGAGIKYFTSSMAFHFANTLFSGLGIALLIPIAQGLIKHDFQSLFTNKNVSFLVDLFPSIVDLSDNTLLIILISVVVFTMILRALFEYLSNSFQAKQEQKILTKISTYIFNRYLSFGLKFYDLSSAARNHINLKLTPRTLITALGGINGLLLNIIECTMLIGIIFFLSPAFGLLSLAIVPIYVVIMKYFNERIKKLMQEDDLEELEEGANNIDYFNRIPLMKAYGAENMERMRYEAMIKKQSGRKVKMQKVLALRNPLFEIITVIFVFIFTFALAFSSSNSTDPEMLPIYLVIFFTFNQLIRKAHMLSSQILRINLSLNRLNLNIAELENNEEYSIESGSVKLSGEIKSIEYKNLSFGYTSGKPVINDFSLKIGTNEHVLIFGKNGSGKSTLMSLLLRFYECPKKTLFINGEDIHKYDIDTIRNEISYISQDTCVFKDTLKNNITYGLSTEVTDEMWADLLKRADLEKLINKLPNGLDTIICEKGANLSGGEKQRVAIARALLRDRPIIIMDEPTSALDVFAENKFNSNLTQSFKDKLVIVITHKANLAEHFDRIVVVDDGRLVELGTYDELKNTCGFLSNGKKK